MVFTTDGFYRGLRRMAPVSIFVVPFGVAFGAAAVEAGATATHVFFMSLFVFAGASQFAALDLWPPQPPYLSLVLLVLVVNARHVIFGAALAPWVNQLPPRRRLAVLAFLTDANFADGYSRVRDGERDLGYVFGGGVGLWAVWVIGSVAGALAGSVIGPLDRLGVDMAMAAFFASLLVGDVRTRLLRTVGAVRVLGPVVIGGVIAAATLETLPLGWNIIAAALAGGLFALLVDQFAASADARSAQGGR